MASGRKNLALIALVLLDGGLKACAWAFLRPSGVGFSRTPSPLRLGYVENSSGFGFDQSRLLSRYGIEASDAFIACTLAVFLALALLIFLWHRVEARAWIKTLAAIAIYLAVATVSISLYDSMSVSLSPCLRISLRALGPLVVAIALYSCVSRPYYGAMALLLLAGTIGNCASLALPPFAVIDYLGVYRRSIGAYVYANAADAYLLAAMIMMTLMPAYWIARWATSSARRRASSP
jgi:hypothetical protein